MITRPSLRGSFRLRQAATVAGALVVMVGAGLPWSKGTRDISPFHLSLKWLIGGSAGTDAEPLKSIGMVILVLVGVIVFGLVTAGRGVTIAGGLGAMAVPLAFAFSVTRTSRPLFDVLGLGVYLTVAGGAIAIIGTLLGAGRRRR
jgi:hypothetical protein